MAALMLSCSQSGACPEGRKFLRRGKNLLSLHKKGKFGGGVCGWAPHAWESSPDGSKEWKDSFLFGFLLMLAVARSILKMAEGPHPLCSQCPVPSLDQPLELQNTGKSSNLCMSSHWFYDSE